MKRHHRIQTSIQMRKHVVSAMYGEIESLACSAKAARLSQGNSIPYPIDAEATTSSPSLLSTHRLPVISWRIPPDTRSSLQRSLSPTFEEKTDTMERYRVIHTDFPSDEPANPQAPVLLRDVLPLPLAMQKKPTADRISYTFPGGRP